MSPTSSVATGRIRSTFSSMRPRYSSAIALTFTTSPGFRAR